jgi:hypothetical protein
MQKGIVVFFFANYLDNVLVWNYGMSGFKRGIEKVGMGSIPTYLYSCLKLPEIQVFA